MIRTEVLIRRDKGPGDTQREAELGAMEPPTADPQEPLRAGRGLDCPRGPRRNSPEDSWISESSLQPERQYIPSAGTRSQKLWGLNRTGCGVRLSIGGLGNPPPTARTQL